MEDLQVTGGGEDVLDVGQTQGQLARVDKVQEVLDARSRHARQEDFQGLLGPALLQQRELAVRIRVLGHDAGRGQHGAEVVRARGENYAMGLE